MEEEANMDKGMEVMGNKLMEEICSTENSSSNGGLVTENFFHDCESGTSCSGGDFTQWEDLWTALTLLVVVVMAIMTLVGVFLLWVGIISRVLGQDIRMDPRYEQQ